MVHILDFYRKIWPVSTGYDLIRIGGNRDGSYLVPNALEGINLCLSPGTCGIVDFETHLAESYGIPSLLCDPAEDAPTNLHPLIKFDRLALAASDSPSTTTLSSWIKRHGHHDSCPLLLSMDIEGAEVQILQEIDLVMLASIRIATIEFHYLDLLHSPEHQFYAEAVVDAIARMTTLFDVVHFKPNNNCPYEILADDQSAFTLYTCIELTFLSKQLRRSVPVPVRPTMLPHPLDHSNVADKPPVNYDFYTKLAFAR